MTFVFKIILFIVLFIFFILILRYIFTNPYTLLSLQNAKTINIIKANSLVTNDTNVASTNFTYSIWAYINDFNYKYGSPKIIFGRMHAPSKDGEGSLLNINGVDPCPVVSITPVENNINIYLSCFSNHSSSSNQSIVHNCILHNIPIQKWFHFSMCVYDRTMDVYLDGKLVKTCLLPGVPNINNNADVLVTPNGGFDGWTSKFQYYPKSLNPQEVYNLYVQGYGGGNVFSNLFSSYQLQVSLVENGVPKNLM
jgi:hypothetical protein